jgi:hypothetical protein
MDVRGSAEYKIYFSGTLDLFNDAFSTAQFIKDITIGWEDDCE